MKKHRSYLILALLGASAAHADTVTPIRIQTVQTDHRDPRMRAVCREHLITKPFLLPGAQSEGCKNVERIFASAVNEGAKACVNSFDLNLRAFFSLAMDDALKDQDYYCTPAQAMNAPCTDGCAKSYLAVSSVTETFTTEELKSSKGRYAGLMKNLIDSATQSPCPELAAHKDEIYAKINRLGREIDRAKITEVRYTRKKVQSKEIKTQVAMQKPETETFQQEFSPMQVGSMNGSNGAQEANNRVGETRVPDANAQVSHGSVATSSGSNSTSSNAGSSSAGGSSTNLNTAGTQARTPALEPRFPENVNLNRFLASGATGTTSATGTSGDSSTGLSAAGTQARRPELEPTFPQHPNLDRFLATGQSGATESTASRPSKPALPQGLEIGGRLSDGRIGFAYTNPKDPSKNYIGFQVRDPKTNKLKTYAYVTSRENAEAVKKNPTLCDQYIKDAQTHSPKANSDASALGRGNDLLGPKNNKKPTPDLGQVAQNQTQDQTQPQVAAGSTSSVPSNGNGNGNGTGINSSANTDTNNNAGTNNSNNASVGTGTVTTATTSPSTGTGTVGDITNNSVNAGTDSQFHIGSDMSPGTGLKPNARTGLNPDAQVGIRTGNARVSPSAASSSEETPRSSVEAQARAQDIAQQTLSIASPHGSSTSSTGSGTGLKDHPNVGLDRGPSGTGIRSQIKPSPDSDKGHDDKDHDGESASTAQSNASQSDALKIGKADSSTSAASSQTASHSKPKPAKKHHSKASLAKTSSAPKSPSQSKPAEAQKQKVAEYTTLAATSKGYGTVRYFLLNKFPNPEIGRWEIVNGKTEEVKYNMPADMNAIKDLTSHPEKLESTFNKAKTQFKQVKPHFLDPDVSEALNNLWQKQP